MFKTLAKQMIIVLGPKRLCFTMVEARE